MHSSFVRIFPVALLSALAACGTPEAGSERLQQLAVGISQDSLMTILGDGLLTATGSDTVRLVRGHRRMRYLIDGKTFEVIYARDEPGSVTEPVAQAIETPVVLSSDQKVLGWGWKFYVEEAMGIYKLPTPLREVISPKVDSGAVARPQ